MKFKSKRPRSLRFIATIVASIFILDSNGCLGQSQEKSQEQSVFFNIHKSYLDANIPDQSKFDSLLARDLVGHFSEISELAEVHWVFLREGPTQSGTSYPKFYLWVKIYENNKLLKEEAARVQAMEKTRFSITDFVDFDDIKNRSKDIYSIFPVLVCEKIEQYSNDKK